MDRQLESQRFARQLQLHRAALWQAGVALLCTVLATAGPAWSARIGSLEAVWLLLAIAFYAAHSFNVYRLAVAEGYNGERVVFWLVLFAPFASLLALLLLKPLLARHIDGSAAGAN